MDECKSFVYGSVYLVISDLMLLSTTYVMPDNDVLNEIKKGIKLILNSGFVSTEQIVSCIKNEEDRKKCLETIENII